MYNIFSTIIVRNYKLNINQRFYRQSTEWLRKSFFFIQSMNIPCM